VKRLVHTRDEAAAASRPRVQTHGCSDKSQHKYQLRKFADAGEDRARAGGRPDPAGDLGTDDVGEGRARAGGR